MIVRGIEGKEMKHVVLFVPVLLAACAQPSVITQPTTVRPQPQLIAQANNGAIFQPNTARFLFEEPSARHVGDIVEITIEETLSASNKADTSANRSSSLEYQTTGNLPGIPHQLERFITRDASVGYNSTNSHDGKGSTSASNTFRGSITVTVIDVLPNGNLVVGGEKQVNVNGEISDLRLTGVINPRDIKAGNTISSKKVADARIEQVGRGTIADANVMGWLGRLFLSVLPF